MFAEVAHQVSTDLGCFIELWCPRCRDNVGADLVVVTDNEVLGQTRGRYSDANRVVRIEATCIQCEQTQRFGLVAS